MNKYETIMIVNPTIDEANLSSIVEKFEELIKSAEGTVSSKEVWGKRKLAYPIQKFNEGYYVLLNFESNPGFVDELTRVYNITDEVIKHIIVKQD